MCALVSRVADTMTDVSDALAKMMDEDVAPNLPDAVKQDLNGFRREHCYIEVHTTQHPTRAAHRRYFAASHASSYACPLEALQRL